MSAVYLCLIAVKILECKRYPLVYSGNEFKAKFGLFKREGFSVSKRKGKGAGSPFRRVFMSLGVMLGSVMLTSCSGSIGDVLDSYSTTIQSRVDWNKEQLNTLAGAGLVSAQMKENIFNEIDSNVGKIAKLDGSGDEQLTQDKINLIKNFIVHSTANGDWAEKDESGKYEMWKSHGHAVVPEKLGADDTSKGFEIFANKDASSTSAGDKLDTILTSAKVYVLNTSALSGKDLAEVSNACKSIKDLRDKCKGDESSLSDEDKATLTAARAVVNASFVRTDITILKDQSLMTNTLENDNVQWSGDADDAKTTEADANKTGNEGANKDLVFLSGGYPAFSMRLHELNGKTVQDLLKLVKNSNDAFLIDDASNGGNKVYSMVYPLSYVDSLEWDGTNAKTHISQSNLVSVNIMTGSVVNTTPTELLNQDERKALEKIFRAVNKNNEGGSSFIVGEPIDYTWKYQNSSDTVSYRCNSIVLRDYLEYTYLPDFMSGGEQFVSLGRRVRLNEFNTDGTVKDINNFGWFIDREGKRVEGAKAVSINDLVDFRSGNTDNKGTAIRLNNTMPDGGTVKSDLTEPSWLTSTGATQGINIGGGDSGGSSGGTGDGAWQQGEGGRWWYKYNNGTYPKDRVVTIGGKKYGFDSEGWMLSNTTKAFGGTTYSFAADGVATAQASNSGSGSSSSNGEWQQGTDGRWWYKFSDGTYPKNKVETIGGKKYGFDSEGWMLANTTKEFSGTTYSFGADGVATSSGASGDGTNGANGTSGDNTQEAQSQVKTFTKSEYATKIWMTTYFPIKDDDNKFSLAAKDAGAIGTDKSVDILYGMCINVSVFDSQLYSSWISISDEASTSGGIAWWNQWLGSAHYSYHIDTDRLKEYLDMNFTADVLSKDTNRIILNPTTIATIQTDFNTDKRKSSYGSMQAAFKIVGIFMIAYAILLPLAWAFDTQTVADFKIVNLITFGKREAIVSKEDIPDYNENKKQYLTFSGAILSMIAIIGLSVLLLTVNFMAVVAGIVNVLIMLVEGLQSAFFNLR